MNGRLSTLAAAYVVARRDFLAILWSRSFIFFLLGPLFPLLVGGLAGGIGASVQDSTQSPQLGVAMSKADSEALFAAHRLLAPRMGGSAPDLVIVAGEEGKSFDPSHELARQGGNLAAIVSGTLAAPVLTGTAGRIEGWKGPVSMLAAQAQAQGSPAFPNVTLAATKSSSANKRSGQLLTAQAAQLLLFLLTMLLAGMVLSNLVEEKGNKIIEVLAAAIPMDAVFFGKLFAMLGVSLVGIVVWACATGLFILTAGESMPALPVPAVGWPLFIALGIIYFAMAYLLIGALFLTIGSMATTVREIQTLSMPVTFLQLVFFFIAGFAMTDPGGPLELLAVAVPFSSPFAMLARAAQDASLWTHAAALAWQVFWVALIVRVGAALFRKLVMKSGPAGSGGRKRGLFARMRRSQG